MPGPLLGCYDGKAFLPKIGSKSARTTWGMLERLVERDPGFYPSKERKILGKMKMDKNCCGMGSGRERKHWACLDVVEVKPIRAKG